MSRKELNWLLQTIKDAEIAERFVMARYERRRISLPVKADVTREWGSIKHNPHPFFSAAIRHSNKYAKTELLVAIA